MVLLKVEKLWCIYSLYDCHGIQSFRLEGTAKNRIVAEFRKLKIWLSNRELKLRIQRDTIWTYDAEMEIRCE